VANGSAIDTGSTGSHSFTVRATAFAGNTNSTTQTYTVVDASCTITGTSSSETLTGNSSDDVICGGGGNYTKTTDATEKSIVGFP
jgi:hypothetical protein